MKTPTTPFALAIASASLALLLSSCSKPEQPAPPGQGQAPNTQVDQPNTPDQAETSRATESPGPTRSDQAATRTAAEELIPPEKSKPPKHKYERLTQRELMKLSQKKQIHEIIENLGEPAVKKQVYTSYGFDDAWYYQWEIAISEDRENSGLHGTIYPRVGMLFETSSSTPSQWYLSEFLNNETLSLPK